jgi:cell division protein FtsQ
MFSKIKIKRGFVITGFAIVLFSLISFVENEHANKAFENIIVEIDDEKQFNYFIDRNEVISLMTFNNTDPIIHKKYKDIDLKTLEMRIKSHKFVENAQVYKDLKGNLMVEVQQCRPLGRIVQTNGPHVYIGSNGNTLPTSEKFTARVVLIDGEKAPALMKQGYLHSEEGKGYVDLLKIIDQDKFWKSQIVQISVNKLGEVKLYPQIGEEVFDLGKPEELPVKFRKMKIYYKTILPLKGFNRYKTVNLKYKDQIICE